MTDNADRNLTPEDVRAIVEGLKSSILKDFKLEVANGVLGWVRKAFIVLLIFLAIQGMSGDKDFMSALTHAGSK